MHRTPEGAETFTFMHRRNFFARQRGLMNVWEYGLSLWSATRPANGEPPREVVLECADCHEHVAYRIQSQADTRRAKRRIKGGALAAAVPIVVFLGLAVVLGIISGDSARTDTARDAAGMGLAASVFLIAGALGTAIGLASYAEGYTGVVRGGTNSLGMGKHSVGWPPRRLVQGA